MFMPSSCISWMLSCAEVAVCTEIFAPSKSAGLSIFFVLPEHAASESIIAPIKNEAQTFWIFILHSPFRNIPLSFGLYNFEDECILRRFHSKIKRNNAQTNVYLYAYTWWILKKKSLRCAGARNEGCITQAFRIRFSPCNRLAWGSVPFAWSALKRRACSGS